MFSRYKKPSAKDATPVAAAVTEAPRPEAAPKPASMRKPKPVRPAEAVPQDKERKRKERLGEIKLELHRALLDNLNLAAIDQASERELRDEISAIVAETLQEKGVVLNREERTTLNQELYDEVKGLGPLETLLQDDTVSDILVNGPHQIFVERSGKLQMSDVVFKDERHLMRIIDKIVSAVGRRVDESNPYVDARLQDGSRFNAMVPPIAVDGSLVSIRKFKKDKLKIDDPVGAISVHGVVGIWGLLAVCLTNGDASLKAQLLGIVVIFLWVFISSLIVWSVIKLVMGLRVSEEEEYEGVDISECGMEAYPEFTSSKK